MTIRTLIQTSQNSNQGSGKEPRYWIIKLMVLVTALGFVLRTPAAVAQSPRGVLFYDNNSGAAVTGRLDVDGSFVALKSYDNLGGTVWTNITPVAYGIALFYSSYGTGATARLDPDGTLTWLKLYTNFSAGWTHIVAAGENRLLFYNASTGGLATGKIDSAGNFTTLQSGALSADFTDITKNLDDDTLVFYRANPLTYYTGYVDTSGIWHGLQTVGGFGSSLKCRLVSGHYNVVFYWCGDNGNTFKVRRNGTQEPVFGYAFVPGFTHIAAASNGMILFYSQPAGSATTFFIGDADATVVSARTYDNFSKNWSLIAAW